MSTPNTSRLELQRGEPIVTPGQHLESGRSRAWAAGRTWRQARGQCPAQKSLGRLGLGLRGKQLAPAARADVALDEFARIRRLEVDAAVAALVALGRVLIVGDRLADLYLHHGLRHSRDCRRAERKRRAGEQHAA
jgi:hypothetical protein